MCLAKRVRQKKVFCISEMIKWYSDSCMQTSRVEARQVKWPLHVHNVSKYMACYLASITPFAHDIWFTLALSNGSITWCDVRTTRVTFTILTILELKSVAIEILFTVLATVAISVVQTFETLSCLWIAISCWWYKQLGIFFALYENDNLV